MTGERGDGVRAPPLQTADDIWGELRRSTPARIGLPRSGASLATMALLQFQLAHARARDAVVAPFDHAKLAADLGGPGVPVIAASSAAQDRQAHLMRPDLGRRLAFDAAAALAAQAGDYDVVFVVTDGLSADAVSRHAPPVVASAIAALRKDGWRIAPVVIVRHGRVAVGDAVASALGAASAVVLLGERPGLSAPDSMGAYLTWHPHARATDADRNCISNIRAEGIGHEAAAYKIVHLLRAMRARGVSGVQLKYDTERLLDESRIDVERLPAPRA